jgi:hypothetical protein
VFEVAGARLAAWFALAEDLDPTGAAEGIYEAVRPMNDQELDAFVATAGLMLDEAARSRVVQIEPDPAPLAKLRAERTTNQPSAESLREIVVLGILAGALGTGLRVPFAPLLDPLPQSGSLDNLLGTVLVALVAWLILRVRRRPPSAGVVFGLYLASWAATTLLVEPLEMASDWLLSRLAPDLWSALYRDPATVLPFAPHHAIAFAAALLGLAVLLRIDARSPRPRGSAAS